MNDMKPLYVETLTGRYVQLEAIRDSHCNDLLAAAADPDLWRFVPFDPKTGYRAKFDALVSAMTAGTQVGFAARRVSDGRIVGSSAFMAIAPEHARVEIGAIWYCKDAQGTAINPETMLLMLDLAFAAGYNRIEFKADAQNSRSRAALRKLGATEEGILRRHMWLPQGRYRDSVYYSILAEEWQVLRARLVKRLAAFS